jgi:hypothetical protein
MDYAYFHLWCSPKTNSFFMKRLLFIAFLLACVPALTFAQAPGTGGTGGGGGSYNPGGPTSTDLCANVYCYTSRQTSSDSWELTIRPVGNELGYGVEYSYDYTTGGVTNNTGWTPVGTWPIVLGTGYGYGVSNIKIRIIAYAPAPGTWFPSPDRACEEFDPVTGLVYYVFNVGHC